MFVHYMAEEGDGLRTGKAWVELAAPSSLPSHAGHTISHISNHSSQSPQQTPP
jgi:hypothetical protein